MKPGYKIYPILTCKLVLDKGLFTYRRNHGEKILFPVFAWLIKGGEETILVDAGCSLSEMARYSSLATEGEEGPPIEESIKKLSISVTDIKTIVLTHLHLDHFLNAKKFSQAKLVVQEEELKFAMEPHPLFSKSYNTAWYEGLDLETISGDSEILPGVDILFTPGHSPGGQSISVATEQGKAVITGFCAIDENFGPEGDIVPGIHSNLFQLYESIIKIREVADIIIPSHSNHMLNVQSIP